MDNSTPKNNFDVKFWRDPESWPLDFPGYIFLARAFDEIGRAQYGQSWDEFPTEPEEPPDDNDDNEDDTSWEQFEQAYERFKENLPEFEARKEKMRISVARCIADRCERGTLVAASRPKAGGKFVRLKKHEWNGDDRLGRFFGCQMHRSKSWIFLTTDSFQNCFPTQDLAESSVPGSQYLSPYLQLMIAVSAEMKVTPENQPLREAVSAKLKNKWRGSLSDHLSKVMATLVRDPESQRGRAKKLKKV